LLCIFYQLEYNLKEYIKLKYYEPSSKPAYPKTVLDWCMPVAAHELLDLFISAEIGSRLGPCLKELNLFNEPEFII
jgi:hypothetical protein